MTGLVGDSRRFRSSSKGNLMRLCLLCASLAVFLGLAGCEPESLRDGPEMVKVSGTLTLDGEPVAGAHIRFSPEGKGPAAFAETDTRGRYQLRTFDPGDGAIPGKYRISVTKEVTEGVVEFESQQEREEYLKKNGRPTRKTTNALPQKFGNPETSDLAAEISLAGSKRVDLELTSK